METVDKRTLKEKWESFKWRCEQKKRATLKWANEHPQAAFFAATTIVGGVSYGGKKILKNVGIKKELRITECRHYDRRTDEYWMSRRPLKTAEKLQLEKYYQDGMSKGEALQRMGLLK